MSGTEAHNSEFDSTNLLVYLWKRRKPLTIVTTLAAIISIVASMMMEERYKSTVVLYPAYAMQVNFENNGLARNNVLLFGEEEEAEQMLQILQSSKIRSKIIERYSLWEHYELDTAAPHYQTDIRDVYEERVSIKRTKYGSVNIQVVDKDPVMAANMANDIADYFDTIRNVMLRERSFPAFEIMQREYLETKDRITWLLDTMTSLSKMGVEHPSAQSYAEFTRGWTTAILEKPSAVGFFEEKIAVQEKYGTAFEGFTKELDEFSKRLILIEGQYKQKKSDYENFISGKFTVEHAEPADKKSYPVRWIIVVMSTLSAFLFTIVFIVALEKFKEIRAQA